MSHTKCGKEGASCELGGGGVRREGSELDE